MSEPVKEFTISRRRWRRGEGDMGNYLRDSSGKQCCLGFLARANGWSAGDIKWHGTLRGLSPLSDIDRDGWAAMDRCGLSAERHDRLVAINDDSSIREAVREQMLTEEFARAGITVRFVR